MRIVTRDEQSELERVRLSADAAHTDETAGRAHDAHPDALRNEYQRDRDRIIHSKAFRRLSHKTQVFLSVEGDHFRTRLTHTLEVSQIARTIARALGLNEDLTEAISLGHDLGHTPFGHTGENALRRCIARYEGFEPDAASKAELAGLFRHNVQSLRVVDVLENDGRGLNLTDEVRDGIVCHTGSVPARTLEGRIVATADRIAYVNHDIDDAIRVGLLSEGDLPPETHAVLGATHADRIETLVCDMVETSAARGDIALSKPVAQAMGNLRSFLFAEVYTSPEVMHEIEKAMRQIEALFDFFIAHPDEIPADIRAIAGGDICQAVVDYIAGMTDRYACSQFERYFIPHSLG